jgi:transcriptional regulator with XRE-family HTH domain
LAQGLRILRSRKEWTQERAAEHAEMNARHYQKLEEGSVNATLRTLERLEHAFGVDVLDLFKG